MTQIVEVVIQETADGKKATQKATVSGKELCISDLSYEPRTGQDGSAYDQCIATDEVLSVQILHKTEAGNIASGVTAEGIIAAAIAVIREKDGEVHCFENALSITALETALKWQYKRRRDRRARGVTGTKSQ